MTRLSRGLGLAACLPLVTAAAAQVPAGYSRLPSPSWFVINSFNSVPGNDIRQIHHVKLSDNFPGEWTSALTVGGLPASSVFGPLCGNGVAVGVAIGDTDPYNATFLISSEACSLNSAGIDSTNLTLSPDGLWAIFERPSGVWLSGRGAVGTSFPVPVQVQGFGAGGSYYPALGRVKGAWQCFYSNGQDIVMQPINLAGASLTGTPTVVSRPAQAGEVAISPVPVTGGDGDVEALWCADLVTPRTGPFTGDADPVWANDLDPNTPPIVQEQNTEYQCCGGLMGGFMNFSHDVLPRWHIMHGEGAWLLGDDEVPGGTANLNTGGVNFSAPSPLISNVFIALGTGTPLPIRGFNGAFGLNPATMVTFPLAQFGTTSLDGTAGATFPIPNNPFLKGWSFALQAVVSDLTQASHVLTNTAWLHVR